MDDLLRVYHEKKAGDANLPLPDGFWYLATCLRSIVVTESDECPESLKDHDSYVGEEAYSFLLKVICGLDSPLLGETEVLGQFKDFLKTNEKAMDSNLRHLLHNLNRDAKKIRAEHLQNLGCTSYGSLLRKQLKNQDSPLTMIGAGSLAQDILPWFAKRNTTVRVYTRSPENYPEVVTQKNVELRNFEQIEPESTGGILVIAAPVTAQWVEANFDLSQYDHVYDLRGDSLKDTLAADHVTPLQTLFASIEKNKRQAQRVKERAIAAIKVQTDHLKLIERPRPFGWEDLWTCY